MNARQKDAAHKAALAALCALDPNAPRANLRDVVPYTGKTLEARARKFTTLAPEFKPQTVSPAFAPLNPRPVFPARCNGTRCEQCLPFESGRNTLPGMERFSDYYIAPETDDDYREAA